MVRQIRKTKKKKNPEIKLIRNSIIAIIAILLLIKISKTIFFIVVFSILAYVLKLVRGKFGLKPVVLDTLHFSTIMISKYIGIPQAVLFVAINTIVIDFLTFIASDGTFANFFFYVFSSIFGVLVFDNTSSVVFGSVAALIYSILYFLYRTFVIPNPPFQVISKCTTSFIFTFLYLSFFGPLVKLLMTGI